MRVLIADDNELICSGLKSLLTQAPELGEDTEFLTAANGMEALSLLERYPCELLITDIRMPDMDGITLMERCHRLWPELLIAVVSGYDEFKYAQKAIEYGAFAYMLKPVDKQELFHIAEKAVRELRIRTEKRSRLNTRETMHKSFLRFLRSEDCEKNNLRQMQAQYPFLQQPCELLLIGFPGKKQTRPDDATYQDVKNAFCRAIGEGVLVLEKRDELVLIYPQGRTLASALEELAENSSFCAAKVTAEGGVETLVHTYAQAKNLYVHRLLHPGKHLLLPEDIRNVQVDFTVPHGKIDRLLDMTGNCAEEELTRELAEIFERKMLSSFGIGYTLALCDTLYRAMRHVAAGLPEYDALSMEDVKNPLDFVTMREYLLYTNEQLLALHRAVYQHEAGQDDNYAMERAQRFIQEHFAQPLTLAIVSNEVSLNYAYFSAAFRHFSGCTFSEYLRRIRMEKAKELLGNPEIRIVEAARLVGYENYKSFYRVFKEETGVTPAEYQQKQYRRSK